RVKRQAQWPVVEVSRLTYIMIRPDAWALVLSRLVLPEVVKRLKLSAAAATIGAAGEEGGLHCGRSGSPCLQPSSQGALRYRPWDRRRGKRYTQTTPVVHRSTRSAPAISATTQAG